MCFLSSLAILNENLNARDDNFNFRAGHNAFLNDYSPEMSKFEITGQD